jgi:environmental stress-induced protein Ves
MLYKLLKKSQQLVQKWSGGTTTQLAIFPPEATYQKRDFCFRISTATVETEESAFTELPGVNRVLMILEGNLAIQHTNHHTRQLNKFDTDTFSGSWETNARGKVTDFNLMTTGTAHGSLTAIVLQKNDCKQIYLNKKHTGVYVYTGSLELNTPAGKLLVEQRDFILLEAENPDEAICLSAGQYSEIIISGVSLK